MGLIFESWASDLGLFVSLVLLYLTRQVWKSQQYFIKRNFYSIPFFECLKISYYLMAVKEDFNDIIQRYYDHLKSRQISIGGAFQFTTPCYIVTDPDLATKILVRDFSHFHDHILGYRQLDPLRKSLFNLTGGEWKTMRRQLAPLFTSGKLKQMFSLMDDCTDNLIKALKSEVIRGEDVVIRDFLSRHSIDVISSCAFGLESNAVNNPNAEFRQMAKKFFRRDRWAVAKNYVIKIFPKLAKALNLKDISKEVDNFMFSLIKQAFEYRRRNKVVRNDFVQLLLELKDKGSIDISGNNDGESVDTEETRNGSTLELTDEILTAQAFSFLFAGWENAASVASFGLLLLAMNPEIQTTARQEVRAMKEKNGNKITYEALKDMTFLDQCVSETLRLETPNGAVLRVCTQDYTLDDGRVIQRGVRVLVPVGAFHMDSEFYPEPKRFNPRRFDHGSQKMTSTYLPFGNGPRICIAQRFALLQINLVLAAILDNFEIAISPKLKTPVKRDPANTHIDVIGGMWLQLKPL